MPSHNNLNKQFQQKTMNRLTILIAIALLTSGSVAQGPIVPTGAPNENPSSLDIIQPPTLAPTRSPSFASPTPWHTSTPTHFDTCTGNNDDWSYTVSSFDYRYDRWSYQNVGCDDDRVDCSSVGNLGLASHQCCKCKMVCKGQCNVPMYTSAPTRDDNNNNVDVDVDVDGENVFQYDDFSGLGVIPSMIIVTLMFCCFVACLATILKKDNPRATPVVLRATRQTMTERRRQQQESNDQGLSEEERRHARYELFVTKFYFQAVLPDKSNITVHRLRNTSIKQDEESPTNESSKTEKDTSLGNEKETSPSEQTMSERLSSWRKPSAKDECCICLECYAVGETICAPINSGCNHVFHEGCINEWLKTNDQCPLCRVELLE